MARLRTAAAVVAAWLLMSGVIWRWWPDLRPTPTPRGPEGPKHQAAGEPVLSWLGIDDLGSVVVSARTLATVPALVATGVAAAAPGPADVAPVERVLAIKFGHAVASLRAEEVCGLESALRAYPAAEVVLLTTHSFNASSLAALAPAYGHRIRLLDVTVFVAMLKRARALPELVEWFASGAWRSGYTLNNLSNGFRIALVYLLGGAYFDLDIVHTRAMPAQFTDVLVYYDNGRNMNNAVIRFAPRHPFLRAVATAFATHFNGTAWASNGPVRFTQTYTDECRGRSPPQPYCATLTILKRMSYYPIHFGKVKDLYEPSSEVDALLAGDDVFGVHIWSAMNRRAITHFDAQTPLYKVALRGCPTTLERYGPGVFLEHEVRTQLAPADLSLTQN